MTKFQVAGKKEDITNAMTEIAMSEIYHSGRYIFDEETYGAIKGGIWEFLEYSFSWGEADSGHTAYELSDELQVRLESFGLTERLVSLNLNNEKAINPGLEMETKGLSPMTIVSIMLLDSMAQGVVGSILRESPRFGFQAFDSRAVEFA